ncbi:MAG TPA: Smr/MutS family protein [Desulfotignum sp.]|nr:Smr/MutS family protein [Desulfotignum sp.]
MTSDSEPAAPEHNRHGLPVVDGQFSASCSKTSGTPPNTTEKEFAALLESYLSRPSRKKSSPPKPMPYHRRIKRYPPPEKDLDLHGFTALGAQLKARSFLTACRHQGYFTVRIIVGKGLHSDPGPVLPDTIEDLLTQLKQQDVVLGFAWEQKKKVRSGAVIVYLRQFDD